MKIGKVNTLPSLSSPSQVEWVGSTEESLYRFFSQRAPMLKAQFECSRVQRRDSGKRLGHWGPGFINRFILWHCWEVLESRAWVLTGRYAWKDAPLCPAPPGFCFPATMGWAALFHAPLPWRSVSPSPKNNGVSQPQAEPSETVSQEEAFP